MSKAGLTEEDIKELQNQRVKQREQRKRFNQKRYKRQYERRRKKGVARR